MRAKNQIKRKQKVTKLINQILYNIKYPQNGHKSQALNVDQTFNNIYMCNISLQEILSILKSQKQDEYNDQIQKLFMSLEIIIKNLIGFYKENLDD